MRRLLLASFLGIVLVALAVSTIPFALFLQSVERNRLLTSMERDAFVLAGRSEEALDALGSVDLAPVRELATRYRDAGGARVVIVDTTSTVVVTNDPEEDRVGISYASRPEFVDALTGVISTGERYSDTLGVTLVYVAVPVFSGSSIVGAVRLTFDKAYIDVEVNRQLAGIGLVALTTLALGALIAIVLSRTLASGLKELDSAALAVSHGDFSVRAREDLGPAEIRALSQAFNEMASRVGSLVETQKRFASDASHQLRTPITALMLRLEGLRESVNLDAKSTERFDAIESELTRLNRLIDGLLALGRSGADEVSRERVDASMICHERVESWSSLADEAGITVTAEIDPGLTVVAVATAVEQILDVYLDNALSVTPTGGTIEVSAKAEGSSVVISIADEGPGMSDAEISRAFDRFWRGSSVYEGTGLGLAVAQQLAEASDARASLSRGPTGGIVARVVFSRS